MRRVQTKKYVGEKIKVKGSLYTIASFIRSNHLGNQYKVQESSKTLVHYGNGSIELI